MPHKLEIYATVTEANGDEYYWEGHRWPKLNDQMLQWFTDKLAHMASFAHSIHGKNEDDANLTVSLEGTIDGVAILDPATSKPPSFTGVSEAAVSKFEEEFHKVGGELVKLGAAKAKGKAKGHGKP